MFTTLIKTVEFIKERRHYEENEQTATSIFMTSHKDNAADDTLWIERRSHSCPLYCYV